MRPSLRKFALTTHITLSVGWIGAVLAYLILVVAAMTRLDAQTLRAAWIAMELIGWSLIVPLALASLLTGFVMSLGTPWGLFRHYWVLISLVLTIVATVVLLQHTRFRTRRETAAGMESIEVARTPPRRGRVKNFETGSGCPADS